MVIIIHRKFAKDAEEAMRYLWDKFVESGIKDAKLIRSKYGIYIGDINIDFRYGDPNRIVGIRFKYFNTDNVFISLGLEAHAKAFGGRELKTLNEVFDVVMEYVRGKESEE